jgi:hypothetical protein
MPCRAGAALGPWQAAVRGRAPASPRSQHRARPARLTLAVITKRALPGQGRAQALPVARSDRPTAFLWAWMNIRRSQRPTRQATTRRSDSRRFVVGLLPREMHITRPSTGPTVATTGRPGALQTTGSTPSSVWRSASTFEAVRPSLSWAPTTPAHERWNQWGTKDPIECRTSGAQRHPFRERMREVSGAYRAFAVVPGY